MPPQKIITEVAQFDRICSCPAKRYVLLYNKAHIVAEKNPTKNS